MNDDDARKQLQYIIGRNGISICEDAKRCEAMLWDLCPECKREIHVLVNAIKEDIPQELIRASNAIPRELLLAELAKRLCDNWGISNDLSRWAVELWDALINFEKNKPVVLTEHARSVYDVAFSPDGAFVLVGQGRIIILWCVSTGEVIKIFKGHSSLVVCISFSKDGHTFLSESTDGTFHQWDITTGERFIVSGEQFSLGFKKSLSPDGSMILASKENSPLIMRNVITGEIIRTYNYNDVDFCAKVFSPNGRMILVGCGDYKLRLIEVETGKEIRVFVGHTAEVTSVAFSPCEDIIISGSLDNTLRFWNLSSGKELVKMYSFYYDEWISMTPEGYYLASKNAEQFIRFRNDSKLYRIENYLSFYHQPDILQKALYQKNKTINGLSSKIVTPEQFITNEKDGTKLMLIPEGEFLAGGRGKKEGGENSFRIFLPSYYLALYPVTNIQYAHFLNLIQPSERKIEKWIEMDSDCSICKVRNRYEVLDNKEDHPVVHVSWFGAKVYAKWADLRLPSELEWEKGARGVDGLEFPWGNTWDKSKCHNDLNSNEDIGTCSVKSYPNGVSPWGLYQMSGNVWEWCEDRYDPEAYNLYRQCRLTPPSYGVNRVLRGGSWDDKFSTRFSATCRISAEAEYRDFSIGFRLAKTVTY